MKGMALSLLIAIGLWWFEAPMWSVVTVLALGIAWLIWRMRLSTIDRIDRMDGREFELFLEEVFTALGYTVTVTPASRDFGADLLLETSDGWSIAVQAKRYEKVVGLEAVQQVAASVPYYGANEGWVVTNSSYTDSAYELAEPNQVRLIARTELEQLLKQAGFKR
ncbi:restriction endonuclease [Exiguobacterium sp. SH0S1]|nr:restriction endonuclease [Exiguobacterium sp. SH31]TCI51166.1 restriction endonuclease [Exiguobacterium sp. SH1S21]TCI67879.1 restriction endonuclease [Exiguobacterium sp. SH0S7]TCI77129.1 restriction endonuclease [Exiguobacterium sp. SH0S1]